MVDRLLNSPRSMSTRENILGNKTVTQIGILVHDIEKASQAFADFLGVEKPPWSMTDTVDQARTEDPRAKDRGARETGVF